MNLSKLCDIQAVVRCMRADKLDEHHSPREPDLAEQPIVVAPDVENHPLAVDDAGTWVVDFDVCHAAPGRHLGFRQPRPERTL
jgi:hypothetical protein